MLLLAMGCDGRWGAGDGSAQAAPPPSAGAAQLPPPMTARYVKLVALSEAGGQAFTAIAEFNLLDATGAVVDRARWRVVADSADANDPAANAVDGNPLTHWHTRWQGTPAPLPHELTIDLGTPVRLSGFRVLPRQDHTANGNIDQYRFHLSADGVLWGSPVAAGRLAGSGGAADEKTVQFAAQTANRAPVVEAPQAQSTAMGQPVQLQVAASDADGDTLSYSAASLPVGLAIDAKTGLISGAPIATGRYAVQLQASDGKGAPGRAAFEWTVRAPAPLPGAVAAAGEVRFVKLEGIAEIHGKPWISMAEFNLLDASGAVLPRTGWQVAADSAGASDQPANAVDGSAASIWHSRWEGDAPPPPHSFVVDLRRLVRVGGFRYLPRQDGSSNGVMAKYRLYTSVDGLAWGRPVAEGDFGYGAPPFAEKTVLLR